MNVGYSELLFALKLFFAAMLAFYIAVRIGLPQPYWSLVTCCIVMNPLSGAARSKALYRFAGTLSGGLASLAILGIFANIPILIVLCCLLAATTAFYFSMLDRTPRGYGYLLCGITLLLVILPAADHPLTAFDTAWGRIVEISLGIVVATLVDSIFWPNSMMSTITARIESWMNDAVAWTEDLLADQPSTVATRRDRLKVVADTASLSLLVAHLRYDPLVSRHRLRIVLTIQHRMLRLIPLLSAVAARIAALSAQQAAAITPVLRDIAAYARSPQALAPQSLKARIQAISANATADAWEGLVTRNLLGLLSELIDRWHALHRLSALLADPTAIPDETELVPESMLFRLRPDYSLAALTAAGILMTLLALCLLWWATGWSQGVGSMIIGGIGFAFYGGLDDPGPAIAKFGLFAIMAFTFAGLLNYGLLPLAHDYPTFMVAMAFFIIPLSLWATKNPMALLIIVIGLSSINLQGQYSPMDFGVFLDTMLGNIVGIFTAFSTARIMRSVSAEHVFMRLQRQEWSEIADLARQADSQARDSFILRSMDRVASMLSRLTAASAESGHIDLLSEIRAGITVAALRNDIGQLQQEPRMAVDAVLDAAQAHFRDLANAVSDPLDPLLERVDQAITAISKASEQTSQNRVLASLVGLRLALFNGAPAWQASA